MGGPTTRCQRRIVFHNVPMKFPCQIDGWSAFSLRAVMWQIAMGVVSKTDENGNFILAHQEIEWMNLMGNVA